MESIQGEAIVGWNDRGGFAEVWDAAVDAVDVRDLAGKNIRRAIFLHV